MTDWIGISQAKGIQASQGELDRLAAVLGALENAFAPLVEDIPVETEPATVFRAEPKEEA